MISFNFAIFLARGVIKILLEELFVVTSLILVSGEIFTSTKLVLFSFKKLLISLSSTFLLSDIIATSSFTLAISPSRVKIFAIYPSSGDSYSIVALSVSTSNKTSPLKIGSFSFLTHLTIFPSSIVGDKDGRLTSKNINFYR